MTLIVASLTAQSPDALVELARGVGADLLEVRLDALDRVDASVLREIAERIPVPLLATLRPTWEGGGYAGPEEARERLLLQALHAGFFAVDVEARAAFADRILESGGRVVLSQHHYESTPSAAALTEAIAAAAERGAWVAKLAVRFTSPHDAAEAVTAAHEAAKAGHRYALMAVNDPVLRLAAPALGMTLAYAAPHEGQGAAPGQPHWRDMAHAHAAFLPPTPKDARLVLLLGDPVAHSVSPAFQNAGFRAAGIPARYFAHRVPVERLGDAVAALRGIDALGANVTVPHKQAVMAHLDALAPSAELAGAVNTIVNENGRLVGHNTDGSGAVRALIEAGVPLRGARVLLLGAGGAARGIAQALLLHDAYLQITNRTEAHARDLAFAMGTGRVVPWEKRNDAEFDLLVNATTVGLHGDATPFDAAHLAPSQAVFDAVYRPGGTPLVQAARARGCRVVPGERMLLHQGVEAFELWTRSRAPVMEMRRALGNALGVSL